MKRRGSSKEFASGTLQLSFAGRHGNLFRRAAGAAFMLLVLAGCDDHHDVFFIPAPSIQQNGIVTGDFNGDGKLDLAVTTSLINGPPPHAGQVEVFLQDPAHAGFFLSGKSFSVGADPIQVATADLNGDGLPDLVTANSNSNTVSVLLNDITRPGNYLPAVNYPCGAAPLSVAIGDLNRDGLPDIAVAVADGVDILFQNPNAPGTFLSPAHLALSGGTFSVAIGDLDGDGIPDIAAAGLSAVDVFFQNPATPGAFFAPASFTAGTQPNAVAIADIDRDGLLDIVVANLGTPGTNTGSSISVLIQDPVTAGNFLAARNFATPDGAHNLAVADLNGDGFPDVAVASVVLQSPNAGVISVFLQNAAAPGNFLFSATYQNGFTPLSVAIGDLNGDGKPDIAIQDGPSILFQDPANPGHFFNEVLIGP
jgi:hypothetical protein